MCVVARPRSPALRCPSRPPRSDRRVGASGAEQFGRVGDTPVLGGVDLEGLKSSDLSNFAGTLFFKFGSF